MSAQDAIARARELLIAKGSFLPSTRRIRERARDPASLRAEARLVRSEAAVNSNERLLWNFDRHSLRGEALAITSMARTFQSRSEGFKPAWAPAVRGAIPLVVVDTIADGMFDLPDHDPCDACGLDHCPRTGEAY